MSLLENLYGTVWLSTEEAMRNIEDIVIMHREGKLDLKAIEAKLGRPLQNAPEMYMRGTTAVIPIRGSIVHRGNYFTEVSGLTSTNQLAKDFTFALESPEVSSIIFAIDSPGGQVTGISEFADMVYNARGKKPIFSFVEGNAQSAAYWIASATEKIYLTDTSGVGSIGVAVFYDDNTKAREEAGVKQIVLKSKKSPNKLADPTTKEGVKLINDKLDYLYEVFAGKVGLYRSTEDNKFTADRVSKEFGAGDTLIGEQAIEVGMADAISSFESLIAELNESKENDMSVEVSDKAKEVTATEDTVVEETVATELDATVETKADEGNFVSKEEYLLLQDQLKELAASNKLVKEQYEADLLKAKAENEANAEKLLVAEAKAKAESFKDKLSASQKDIYVDLYKVAKVADTDGNALSLLDKFVTENTKSVTVLTEEQLANEDLTVLDEEEVTTEDNLEDEVSAFAKKQNRKSK